MDVAAGLRAVRGRWPSYERLLHTFLRDHGSDGSLLTERLAAGDFAHAVRIAHTLKGLAGTLGAGPLHTSAEQLERALRSDGVDAAQRMRLATVLGSHLERFAGALRAVLPGQIEDVATEVDWPRVRAVAEALELLLSQDDARALDLFDLHAADLRAAAGKNAVALERHVHRFEFDSAREVLLTTLAHWPSPAAAT